MTGGVGSILIKMKNYNCGGCGKSFPPNELTPYKGLAYCKNCLSMENEFVTSGKAAWIVVVLFTILAIIFGGCTNTISDMNGSDAINIIISKSDKAVLVKHQYVWNEHLQVEYLLFEQGYTDFKAFDNLEKGDTIK